jgi:Ubiquitin family
MRRLELLNLYVRSRSRGFSQTWNWVTSRCLTSHTHPRDRLRVKLFKNNHFYFVFTLPSTRATMAPLKVHIKHSGNKYDLELDPDQPPLAFKEAVYQSTGVPIDRMKIMVKGGVLKVSRHF